MKKTCKIIIADDHKIFREGLKMVLSTIENCEVVAEAENGKDFLEIIKKIKPDIVFLDLNMPEMNGQLVAKELIKDYPEIKIIVISSNDEKEVISKLIYEGIHGYLLKTADYNDIKKAIQNITEGKTFFQEKILKSFMRNEIEKNKKAKLPNFTKRELQVLKLHCCGDNTNSISKKLFISERTVHKHKQNIMSKSNTHNGAELIAYAIKNKIIEIKDIQQS